MHPLHPERAVVAGSRLCSATTSTTSEQRRDDRRRVTDVTGLKVGWRFSAGQSGWNHGNVRRSRPFWDESAFFVPYGYVFLKEEI